MNFGFGSGVGMARRAQPSKYAYGYGFVCARSLTVFSRETRERYSDRDLRELSNQAPLNSQYTTVYEERGGRMVPCLNGLARNWRSGGPAASSSSASTWYEWSTSKRALRPRCARRAGRKAGDASEAALIFLRREKGETES